MNNKHILQKSWAFLKFLPVFIGIALAIPMAFGEDQPLPDQTKPEEGVTVMRFKGMLPEVLPIPGDPRPYADSPYASQIDKALAYMAYKDRSPNRLFSLALLDYLQRRYGLHERYSLKITYASHLQGESAKDLGKFQRLIDPDFKIDEETILNSEPQERLALQALYYDLYPSQDTLLVEMKKYIDQGMSPFLPSIGFSFFWLRDNGFLASNRDYMLIRDGLAVAFRNHLRERGLDAYMVGQCLAFLFALGHSDMVEEIWLKTAAEAQNEDGGWPGGFISGQKGTSDDAATINILWALMQHALPNAPSTPMVQPTASPAK
jgi:hypothetical protein